MSAVDKVLQHLEGVQKRGTGYRALCPAHDDHNPSLDVDEAQDGSALVICRANCPKERVLEALEERGFKRRDLFADGGSVVPFNGRSKAARKSQKRRERVVKAYHVKDADGVLRGVHERLEDPDDPDHKSFLWKLPNGRYSKGDIKPETMPLYGSELVAGWPEDYGIVVGEGETPAAALRSRNIRSVGTVCGASMTPNPDVLEVLRGRRVILWPDNDQAGREHMRRVGRILQGVAASVQWYEWAEAPEKGDGADHPAVKRGDLEGLKALGRELRAAPVLEVDEIPDEAPALRGRTLLGKIMREGVEPPEELVPDLLLAGKVHSLYSAASTGKTFLMLWLVLRVIERGLKVLVYDRENGDGIMAERLEALGADPERVDELVYYSFYPELPTTEEGLLEYESTLDEIRPSLVVFDSLIGFLSYNGLDENSSNDVSTWATHYAHPARARGAAVLVLDHVPKEGASSRGSSRKRDEVDVMWALKNPLPFDRDTVGRIVVQREKDREGWLPENVGFSVGGGAEGFVFRRSAGTIEVEGEDGLTPSARKALEVLDGMEKGPKATQWQREAFKAGMPRSTFYRAKDELYQKGKVFTEGKRFFIKGPSGPKEVPLDQAGPAPEKVPSVPHPYGVGPSGTGGSDREIDDGLADLADTFKRENEGEAG